jgi:hypothetical protein
MGRKKKLSDIVRIPEDGLWIAQTACMVDFKGVMTHLSWPTLNNTSWFDDILRYLNEKNDPKHAVHESNGIKRHWKMVNYTEDGWWYRHDRARSSKVEYETRLFIPRELQFHPDYKVKKGTKKR